MQYILKDSSSSSSSTKLEKADILELTVEYLRTMSTETVASRATEGYVACLREVDSFLRNAERPTSCSLGMPSPSTPASDRIRRLRTELIARLSSRAPNVVIKERQHHLSSIPEVTSSPLSSSPPTNRRVLADRNYRPVAPPVENISTTPTYGDCIPRDILHPSTSLFEQSSQIASGSSTPLGRACTSVRDRHRRPKPYSLPRHNKPSSGDSMAMSLSGFESNVDRLMFTTASSPSTWSSVSKVGDNSSKSENTNSDENCVPMRYHQLDVGNNSEMHPNERNYVMDSDDQSSMWRPW